MVGVKEREGQTVEWAEQIPEEQWTLYEKVIEAAQERELPFLLGGAFGLATYTGRWRNTKDLDCFILPRARDGMVALLAELGFQDYYDQLPYERHWIYRAVCGDIIVDAIWQMANRRTQVDESWFDHAPTVHLRGHTLPILAPEELIWTKIYVLQRDRCDWPDLFNVLHRVGAELDWERLLRRLQGDAPLLGGLLKVFSWLCPGCAQEFPGWIWERLALAAPPRRPAQMENAHRVRLIDTRNWFGPILPPDEPLEV